MLRRLRFALLLLLVCGTLVGATNGFAGPSVTARSAQAEPAPAAPAQAAPDPAAPAADAQQAAEEPIGNVATVIGSASVVRNNETTPLKVKDDIYLNDVVQTGAKSSLGITFSDATTFNLRANSQITIDSYVYEDGGKQNAGVFDVAKGTVAFVAAAVAKTGDMKITTPTATLGIRGTTGLVEVPEGAAANSPNNVAIKLYPDADGRVGRIEVNDRAGARLGFLSQGSSGFTIRPGSGGMRFAAVPLTISPQQVLRDQGFVRQVHSTQNLGRRVFNEQRDFRRANPGFNRGNAPRRGPQQNGLPGQNRTGQQPGLPNRPGQQQPGLQNRPGQQQQPGQQIRPGQRQLQNRPGQPQQLQQPGSPNRQGQQLQRPGSTPSGSPRETGLPPRPGQPQQPATAGRPGAPAQTGAPSQAGGPQRVQQPGGQQQGVQQPGFRQGLRPGGLQAAPGVVRQGQPARPAPARVPPLRGSKPPKDVR
ncbi:FecR domain-containing protein [Bradyrhizobium sp. JYMT SZCCT0180]|uniref:FecR family protein n=1 Tax=Bradyrhizobium sp. JYMT SZCCT0180 TaxID=2807666 RepID=UPI001BA44DBA|nr:FecR domain-containing protein [Bradyrhizobium sp. JYMT SZCCT0180]MBR1212530.1 FecR domain-containing protein [Bradyrhizobium sp. JYMT SZCCT0180]